MATVRITEAFVRNLPPGSGQFVDQTLPGFLTAIEAGLAAACEPAEKVLLISRRETARARIRRAEHGERLGNLRRAIDRGERP